MDDVKLREEESTAISPSSAAEPEHPHWIHGFYYRALAIAGALVISLILVGVAIRFSTRYTEYGGFSSTTLVYRGSYTLVNWWDTTLSLVINILSEVTLGASNYAMQSRVAPTRDEIDQFHAQHK